MKYSYMVLSQTRETIALELFQYYNLLFNPEKKTVLRDGISVERHPDNSFVVLCNGFPYGLIGLSGERTEGICNVYFRRLAEDSCKEYRPGFVVIGNSLSEIKEFLSSNKN